MKALGAEFWCGLFPTYFKMNDKKAVVELDLLDSPIYGFTVER
jgi:hypothetical protein